MLNVEGQNVSLHILLTRTGNGSEYPAFLDMHHGTEKNVTWAWQYLNSEDEYKSLIRQRLSSPLMGLRLSNQEQKVLMIPSLDELESTRALQERAPEGTSCRSSINGRWPVNKYQARYDFEEASEEYKETYEFDIDLPM